MRALIYAVAGSQGNRAMP